MRYIVMALSVFGSDSSSSNFPSYAMKPMPVIQTLNGKTEEEK